MGRIRKEAACKAALLEVAPAQSGRPALSRFWQRGMEISRCVRTPSIRI